MGPVYFIPQEYLPVHPDTRIFSRPRWAKEKNLFDPSRFPTSQSPPTAPSPNSQNTSFLGHCLVPWGIHAKRELPGHETPPAQELLKEYCG